MDAVLDFNSTLDNIIIQYYILILMGFCKMFCDFYNKCFKYIFNMGENVATMPKIDLGKWFVIARIGNRNVGNASAIATWGTHAAT